MDKMERIAGCLLGGGVGDALGGAVEFHSLSAIKRLFGPTGIKSYGLAYGRQGAITDDTQMTLFTAEGLILGAERGRERGVWDPKSWVYEAYLRWLSTQGRKGKALTDKAIGQGFLLAIPALNSPRAPGNTCLSALRTGVMGTIENPINDSKGCGGIMRSAPAGLICAYDPFLLGCEVAAITHGHPSGYLSAGFFALLIDRILAGESLTDAIEIARKRLIGWGEGKGDHEETLRAVDQAVALARPIVDERDLVARAKEVESLGGGWTGEEALAIALYCALSADDFTSGLRLAVNHGGDSDSTGSIYGNIVGALWGEAWIPGEYLRDLEIKDQIRDVARRLAEIGA